MKLKAPKKDNKPLIVRVDLEMRMRIKRALEVLSMREPLSNWTQQNFLKAAIKAALDELKVK